MKKILSILMVVCMVIGLLPIGGLAEGGTSGNPCANGHKWGSWQWEGSDFKCGETYSQWRQCSRCGEYQDRAATYEHRYGDWQVTDPTCLEGGKEVRRCRRCGRTQTKKTDPLGHDWGEWYVVTAPVGPTPGLERRECQRCHITEEREIPGSDEPMPPVEDRNPSFYLELVSVNDVSQVGDTIHSVWKLTNTGNVEACFTSIFFDDHGKGGTIQYFDIGKEVNPNDNCVAPGEYLNIWLDFPLNENDVNEQQVDRSLVAHGVLAYPEGTDTLYAFDHNAPVSTNVAELHMDLVNAALYVELLSAELPCAEGDIVHSQWKVTNVGDADVYTCLYTFHGADGETAPHTFEWTETSAADSSGTLCPGDYMMYTIDLEVTAADVAAGHVFRTSSIAGYISRDGVFIKSDGSSDTVRSNVVELDLPFTSYFLDVEKTILNQPQDALGFQAGEVVQYLITATNNSPYALYSTQVYDSLYGDELYADLGELAPGASASVTFDYTVSDWDAEKGLLINAAFVYGFYAPHGVLTGATRVVCDTIPSRPRGYGDLVKEDSSAPDDYYREGDVIHYTITLTNQGDVPFSDVSFYDSQVSGIIATALNVQPGDSVQVEHTYVVSPEDIGNWVYNTAYAVVTADYGSLISLTSNTVKSPTGEESFDYEQIDLPADGMDSCVRTLVNEGKDGYTYELHFCGAHAGIQKDIQILVPASSSPEVEAIAWEYAASFWKDAASDLYAALSNAAKGNAKSTLMAEQLAFTAMADNYAATMKQLCPEHPEKAAYLVARLWENKVVDMCWLLHHGNEARPDHLTAAGIAYEVTPSVCGITPELISDKANTEPYTDSLCSTHCVTDKLTKSMLQTGDIAAAWSTSAAIWQREASRLMEKAWRSADASARDLFPTFSASFTTWLDSQRALYSCIYDSAVVEEINARSVMELVLTLCSAE